MTSVSLSADRRFHRAHIKPGRRRRYWRALLPLAKYLVLGVVAALALYWATTAVAQARVLQINRIMVHGNQRLSEGEILGLLNGLRGDNLVSTDLEQWRTRLLASPWVREASLRRSLPATVDVVISEREPLGIGRVDGALYLIDERGMVIDEYGPEYAEFDLPIVDGLRRTVDVESEDEWRAQLASHILTELRTKPDVARQVSQIDVSDPHNAAVMLNGDPAVVYVGEERFVQRIQSYLELSSTFRERVDGIDYVDLRFDDRIYVRPDAAKRQ